MGIAGAITLAALAGIAFVLFRLATLLAPGEGAARAGPPPGVVASPSRRPPTPPAAPARLLPPGVPAIDPAHPFARTFVTGRVFDLVTGEGVGGAVVVIRPTFDEPKLGPRDGDGSVSVLTQPDGGLSVKGIPPGHFDVEIRATGYLPVSSSFKKLGAVEDDEGLDFGMLRASAIEGRVVTSGGQPVRGARIAAVHGSDLLLTPATPIAVSGDDGRFVLDPVDAREVTIFATHPEFQPVTLVVDGSDDAAREVDILLPPGRRITGTVRDKDGPVRGALVSPELVHTADKAVYIGGQVAALSATTDRDGRFTLTAGELGMMTLRVDAPGYRRAVRGIATGRGPDEAPDAPVEVDFELEPAVEMSGRVIGADGRPAVKARVVVSSEAGGYADGETDAAGAFHLEGLHTEGPYTVVIRHHAHPPFTAEETTVRGSHVYTLAPQGRVLGRVIDARTGLPVTRYGLRAIGPLQMRSEAETLSGALEVDQLAAGTYTLVVEAEEYRPATVEGVVVGLGAVVTGVVVKMEPSATIAGRVRGRSEGELLVQAYGEDGELASGAVVEEDGCFVVRNLPGGTYALRVIGAAVSGERSGVRVASGSALGDVEIPLVHE